MLTRRRNLLLIIALFAAAVAAGPAGAITSWHVDYLHGAELGKVSEGNPLSYSLSYDPVVSGDVTVHGAWLGVAVADDHGCRGRRIAALFRCDWKDLFYEGESVDIDVAGGDWMAGPVPGTYVGDITALGLITEVGDSVGLVVSSTLGDFNNFLAVLAVRYEVTDVVGGGGGGDQPGAHMPEPTAATVFGIGTLLVAGATRRRSKR